MTEQKPENPPAFPQLEVESCNRDGHGDLIEPFTSASGGMTLRDYFAAAALQGTLARGDPLPNRFEFQGKTQAECYADMAYTCADAMLAERAKKAGPA